MFEVPAVSCEFQLGILRVKTYDLTEERNEMDIKIELLTVLS